MLTDAWTSLRARLARLHIREADLKESFVRSGGHGGQNVNKVSTCVLLVHEPSGLSIRCEEERSQNRNRFIARERLADAIEKRQRAEHLKKQQSFERHRRQTRKPTRKAKENKLRAKHHRAEIKKFRRSPGHSDD